MSVNSISSNSLSSAVLDLRPATEQKEVKSGGYEKKAEGDKDDKGIAPKPSVSASGQTIGTTISTKA